jgi:16S rRNA (guanine966-N2)-methyltransferase
MSLRVSGGSANGIMLKMPSIKTRPTSSRLKESLFGILESANLLRSSVIDLYAGSGALGIEALSRGVEQCFFIESNRTNCYTIQENLKLTKVTGGNVINANVGQWQASNYGKFSLVIADPPYDDMNCWVDINDSMSEGITEDATIVVEHRFNTMPPLDLVDLPLWKTRRHGDGAITIYRF